MSVGFFTNQDFKLLEDSLELLQKQSEHHIKMATKDNDVFSRLLKSLDPSGHDQRTAEIKKDSEKQLEDIIILKAKLVEYKRWQRQQNTQSTNTTQA